MDYGLWTGEGNTGDPIPIRLPMGTSGWLLRCDTRRKCGRAKSAVLMRRLASTDPQTYRPTDLPMRPVQCRRGLDAVDIDFRSARGETSRAFHEDAHNGRTAGVFGNFQFDDERTGMHVHGA